MKYILPIIAAFLLIGCSDKEKKEQNKPQIIKQAKKKEKKNEKKIIFKLNDINLTFVEGKIIYPQKKVVLLFDDNTSYCKLQKEVLNKHKIKFYSVKNPLLEKEFNVTIYPTLVILDKNKTVKFENFTPYEFLKETF